MYCLFKSILRMNKIKLNTLECGEHMSLQFMWYLPYYRLACLDVLHLRISEDVVLKVEKRDFLQDPNTRSSACLDALFFHAVSRRKQLLLEYVDPGIRGWNVTSFEHFRFLPWNPTKSKLASSCPLLVGFFSDSKLLDYWRASNHVRCW